MQTRSARAKPWLTKSPGAFATSASSDRAASVGDRSQLAADILNEDRVALAARLRDPGDDPPPNYLREPNAADDEPYVPAMLLSLALMLMLALRLNVSRNAIGGKSSARDSNFDSGQVIGVCESEEWREISMLQTVRLVQCLPPHYSPPLLTSFLHQEWLGACVKISRFLISMQS